MMCIHLVISLLILPLQLVDDHFCASKVTRCIIEARVLTDESAIFIIFMWETPDLVVARQFFRLHMLVLECDG